MIKKSNIRIHRVGEGAEIRAKCVQKLHRNYSRQPSKSRERCGHQSARDIQNLK
jgi:hypothetical protein